MLLVMGSCYGQILQDGRKQALSGEKRTTVDVIFVSRIYTDCKIVKGANPRVARL